MHPHSTLSDTTRALGRHQRRREAGAPALSALLGPAALARAHWSAWCAARGFPPVVSLDGTRPACAWVAAVPRPTALAALGLPPPPPGAERELELEGWLRAHAGHAAGALALGWLAGAPAHEEEEALTLAQALAPRLAPPDCPALLVDVPARTDARAALEAVARLCTVAPRAPVAFTCTADRAEVLLASAGSTPTLLLREGHVWLAAPRAAAHVPPEVRVRCARSLARLEQEGASPELLHAFVDAATAGPARARSAAEMLLHRLLEEHPETRGLFALNGTLPWHFGPRPVEVDLLSAPLALALEVDGWHPHRGPDDHRRDRHKDLALQQHGLQVMRVLAEDVVHALGDTLDTVRGAVALRRAEVSSPRALARPPLEAGNDEGP